MPERGKYQFFADLRDEEYSALREDIRKRGVLIPVEVDEAGEVLDGHNRLRIAAELGIECPRVVRVFGTEEEKREHALKMNLLRRNLDAVSWAEAFAEVAKSRGVRLGSQGRQEVKTATVAVLAQELGVPERTARRRLETLKLPNPIREAVRAGEISPAEAVRKHARDEKRRVRVPRMTPPKPDPNQQRRELILWERINNGDVLLRVYLPDGTPVDGCPSVALVDKIKGIQGQPIPAKEALLRLRGWWEKPPTRDHKYVPIPTSMRAALKAEGLL